MALPPTVELLSYVADYRTRGEEKVIEANKKIKESIQDASKTTDNIPTARKLKKDSRQARVSLAFFIYTPLKFLYLHLYNNYIYFLYLLTLPELSLPI